MPIPYLPGSAVASLPGVEVAIDLGETESDKRAVIGNENFEYPGSILSRSKRYESSNFSKN